MVALRAAEGEHGGQVEVGREIVLGRGSGSEPRQEEEECFKTTAVHPTASGRVRQSAGGRCRERRDAVRRPTRAPQYAHGKFGPCSPPPPQPGLGRCTTMTAAQRGGGRTRSHPDHAPRCIWYTVGGGRGEGVKGGSCAREWTNWQSWRPDYRGNAESGSVASMPLRGGGSWSGSVAAGGGRDGGQVEEATACRRAPALVSDQRRCVKAGIRRLAEEESLCTTAVHVVITETQIMTMGGPRPISLLHYDSRIDI